MEFSTRSAQLHPNPMDMLGVLTRGPGAREGKRGGMARTEDMVGISVETTVPSHMTAHMVRCLICPKHTCFLCTFHLCISIDQFYDGNLQTSITTPATRATPSPTTRVPTAAAPGQMPACWTHAAPSWNGIHLSTAAPRSKENLANTRSALISLKASKFKYFVSGSLNKT